MAEPRNDREALTPFASGKVRVVEQPADLDRVLQLAFYHAAVLNRFFVLGEQAYSGSLVVPVEPTL